MQLLNLGRVDARFTWVSYLFSSYNIMCWGWWFDPFFVQGTRWNGDGTMSCSSVDNNKAIFFPNLNVNQPVGHDWTGIINQPTRQGQFFRSVEFAYVVNCMLVNYGIQHCIALDTLFNFISILPCPPHLIDIVHSMIRMEMSFLTRSNRNLLSFQCMCGYECNTWQTELKKRPRTFIVSWHVFFIRILWLWGYFNITFLTLKVTFWNANWNI